MRQFKAEAEAIRRGLSGEAEKSVRQLEERVAEVLQKAAERLEAVRREAYKRLREIAHDFLWVGRSEPLFTIALPGAEEALRAAERALRAFAEGADREAVLRQFREEVAKVKQQYAALGADVRHLEGIEREVASVLQRLERPSPVKAPEDAAAKAELVRRALAALSDDRTAKLALALYARGVDVDEALAARRAYEKGANATPAIKPPCGQTPRRKALATAIGIESQPILLYHSEPPFFYNNTHNGYRNTCKWMIRARGIYMRLIPRL